MTRRTLPARRASRSFRVLHHTAPATAHPLIVSTGHYENGDLGEIFVKTDMRTGTDTDTNMHDFAVLVSLALQHGCPLRVMREAMKRNSDGSPTGIFAHILDNVEIELARTED